MINEVRNTVLSILNKNNYGYISPSDFNLFASQAQMELYEEMFSAYNKIITMENNRVSGTDYADMKRTYEEAMELFISNKPLQNFAGSVFLMPSAITTGWEKNDGRRRSRRYPLGGRRADLQFCTNVRLLARGVSLVQCSPLMTTLGISQ